MAFATWLYVLPYFARGALCGCIFTETMIHPIGDCSLNFLDKTKDNNILRILYNAPIFVSKMEYYYSYPVLPTCIEQSAENKRCSILCSTKCCIKAINNTYYYIFLHIHIIIESLSKITHSSFYRKFCNSLYTNQCTSTSKAFSPSESSSAPPATAGATAVKSSFDSLTRSPPPGPRHP